MKTINQYITEHMFSGKKITVGNQLNDCVDFNLPSGTLWCTHNLGANDPTEHGDYFSFGEIVPKKDYSQDTFNNLFLKNGKEVKRQKHLFPKEDAAHVIMGGRWQMPTSEHVEELLQYTNHGADIYKGTVGIKFISKEDKNKFIFFPLAGYKQGKSIYGVRGTNIWVNDDIRSYAEAFYYSISKDSIHKFNTSMNLGLSIRPVITK